MADSIFSDKASKQSSKYIAYFQNTDLDAYGLPFLIQIRDDFPLDLANLIITNYHHPAKITYILKLNRDHIELLELLPQTKNNILYSFSSDKIYLNHKEMSVLFK